MIVEPSLEVGGGSVSGRLDRPVADLQHCSVGTLVGLLAAAALVLVWRRLAGALASPLPSSAMLLVGLTSAGAAACVRFPWKHAPRPGGHSGRLDRSQALRWLALTSPSISLLAIGAALTLPGTPVGGLLVFWAVLGVEELYTWRPRLGRHRRSRPTALSASLSAAIAVPAPSTSKTDSALPAELAAAAATAAAFQPPTVELPPVVPALEVLQQLTRRHAADGSEDLSGWLRMPFAPGQRTASLHVAFCPPFARTPEVSAQQLDGPAVRIKTGQLLPYGVRLDLKLASAADSAADVLLRFSARSAGEGDSAGQEGRATLP